MTAYRYQLGFSEAHPDTMYDIAARLRKADKMLAVLDYHFNGQLSGLRVLDVGCSTGIIASRLAERFGDVVGIDIDEHAVRHAQQKHGSERCHFLVDDAMHIGLPAGSFDVLVCAHVYEHVPDARRLMAEVYRVLKPGGVCYFAAGNRIQWIEAHYGLPLLSVIPKRLAHPYVLAFGRGAFYYENHLTLWGLRALVAPFDVIDYTIRVLEDPARFSAGDMVPEGSLKQRAALWVARAAYWLCPTYIWLLRRPRWEGPDGLW